MAEPLSTQSMAASDQFSIFVGPNAQLFSFHSALLASKSPVLATLVEGGFRESTERRAVWDDVDEVTMGSFWQYIYSGDYKDPKQPKVEKPSEEGGAPATKPPACSRLGAQGSVRESGIETPALVHAPWSTPTPASPEVSTEKPETRVQMVRKSFLKGSGASRNNQPARPIDFSAHKHHAKVYLLADRYDVKPLMKCALGKLKNALKGCEIEDASIDGYLELLEICFRDTPGPLQEVALPPAVKSLNTLWNSSAVQEFAEDCGAFSRALIDVMCLHFRSIRCLYNQDNDLVIW